MEQSEILQSGYPDTNAHPLRGSRFVSC
jgi:hypothetical protein